MHVPRRGRTCIHMNESVPSRTHFLCPVKSNRCIRWMRMWRSDAYNVQFEFNAPKNHRVSCVITRRHFFSGRRSGFGRHTIATPHVIIHRNRMGALSPIGAPFLRKMHFYLYPFHRRLIWCILGPLFFPTHATGTHVMMTRERTKVQHISRWSTLSTANG